MPSRTVATRHSLGFWTLLWAVGWLASAGCTSDQLYRGQSPDDSDTELSEELDEVRLVNDLAVPWGVNYLKVESIALVTALGTNGSDPPPSPQRSMLIKEMQTHEVSSPHQILRSAETSMVRVRAYLPPGVQEGDRIDVEVRVPPGSETRSLRGGWLMQSRLREMAYLQNQVHTGRVVALAGGPVLVDSVFQGGEDPVHETRGRVLGGGVALESRPLGLAIRSSNASVRTSALIGAAINARFHTFDRGIKKGVATPKRDNYIELEVHPRYKHNIARYIRVIGNIGLAQSTHERARRLALLQRMLLEPATAATAAMQLEAIGHEAVPVLEHGLNSSDPEVKFYSAEALAYLDEADAAPVLAEAARSESAFRWHALTALSVMDHVSSYDALTQLLSVPSAETRYGAFRALRIRNPSNPTVRGEVLADTFGFHVLNTGGEPMVHIARSHRPEIVVFGHQQQLNPPSFLFAGKEILIKAKGPDRLQVARFTPGKEDQYRECSRKLDDVVHAIVDLGGGYTEVLQALHAAKQRGYLDSRVVVDARPKPGRRFRRDELLAGDAVPMEDDPSFHAANPIPELFSSGLQEDGGSDGELPPDIDPPAKDKRWFGFLGNMFGGSDK